MKLVKGDKTVVLTLPGTIDAYLSEGWVEAVEEEEQPKPKKKTAKSEQ